MKIPSTFQMLCHTINVQWVDQVEGDANAEADIENLQITLGRNQRSDSVVQHNFYHEFVHHLFSWAGREDLSKDETLVDVVSGLLLQANQTATYEDHTHERKAIEMAPERTR